MRLPKMVLALLVREDASLIEIPMCVCEESQAEKIEEAVETLQIAAAETGEPQELLIKSEGVLVDSFWIFKGYKTRFSSILVFTGEPTIKWQTA